MYDGADTTFLKGCVVELGDVPQKERDLRFLAEEERKELKRRYWVKDSEQLTRRAIENTAIIPWCFTVSNENEERKEG